MKKLLFALGLLLAFPVEPAVAQLAQCGRIVNGASAAATTLLVSGGPTFRVHLCGWDITSTAAATFQLVEGGGATCGTNTVNITAAHTLTAQSVLSSSSALPGRYSLVGGNNLCMVITGTGPVQWTVYYTQF
jgi:hypothetical protein